MEGVEDESQLTPIYDSHPTTYRNTSQLEKDRDAQAEAVRELVDAATSGCIVSVQGTGKWTTSCTLCGDHVRPLLQRQGR